MATLDEHNVHAAILSDIFDNNNNNNNNNNNISKTMFMVFMAKPLREFTRFI